MQALSYWCQTYYGLLTQKQMEDVTKEMREYAVVHLVQGIALHGFCQAFL